MRLPKAGKVLTVGTLALLLTVVPTLTDRNRSSMVSYNPAPADFVHAPLSSMGLLGLIRGISDPLGLASTGAGSASNMSIQNALQTISQNAVRFVNDTSYFPQTETTVAVDPSGTNTVGGFNDMRFLFCPVLPSDCGPSGTPASLSGFTASMDGGRSVLKGSDLPDFAFPNTTRLYSFGDPSIASSVDGNFYYSSLGFGFAGTSNGVILAKSNSMLFSPSVSCVTQLSVPTSNACWTTSFVSGNVHISASTLEDKPLIAVDYNKGKAFGSVYVGWTHFNLYSGQSAAYLARCDSGLKSCSMLAGGTLPPLSGSDLFADFTTPAVDRNGNVYVAWCNYGTYVSFGPITCRVRSSPPGGNNFGPPSTVLSFMGSGTMLPSDSATIGFATEQFRTFSIPDITVDNSHTSTSGNLYFTIQVCTSGRYIALTVAGITDNPGNCGLSSILLSKSSNGGSTWSPPQIVSQPAVNAQPWVTVDPVTGHLFIVYYTTQFDPFNHRIDVVASRSVDGGSSFTQERATTVSNEPDSDPNMHFYFSPFGGSWTAPQYGDYFQAEALGGTLWILFTANYAVEQGTFQTDPWLAVLTNQ